MFIEDKIVYNYKEVKDKNLSDILRECIDHFFTNLKDYMGIEHRNVFSDPKDYYNLFSTKYGECVSYNSKNLVFSKVYVNISEYILLKLDNLRRAQSTVIYNTITKEEVYIPKHGSTDSDYLDLFGKNKFPNIKIDIIRVGNHDYSYYTLVRWAERYNAEGD